MNDVTATAPVTYADVEAAAARLEGVAHRTPVATSSQFDALAADEEHSPQLRDAVYDG